MKEGAIYLVYACKRWGLLQGIRRWWEFHGSPLLWPKFIRRKYRHWKLIDRREKKTYSRTVYAINRDGDMYLVECPQCHNTQHLWKEQKKPFECNRCQIAFSVYTEDGVVRLKDHRAGNIPLPAVAVRDDQGTWHLGIAKDAPWWWTRRTVERDLHEGKDGHGHYPYEIIGSSQRDQAEEIGVSDTAS